MNKKGFTLMELLLVVAVLAIVAAAAAPTFFGGAQEAMEEAKKASMNSAYQNCISGSNMLMAIAASKGITPNSGSTISWADPASGTVALEHYTPEAARVFTNKKSKSYIFSAQYDSTDKKVVIYYGAGTTDAAATIKLPDGDTVEAQLKNLWTAVAEAD